MIGRMTKNIIIFRLNEIENSRISYLSFKQNFQYVYKRYKYHEFYESKLKDKIDMLMNEICSNRDTED